MTFLNCVRTKDFSQVSRKICVFLGFLQNQKAEEKNAWLWFTVWLMVISPPMKSKETNAGTERLRCACRRCLVHFLKLFYYFILFVLILFFKTFRLAETFNKLPDHICREPHLYSMHDLLQVASQLNFLFLFFFLAVYFSIKRFLKM